MKIVLDAGHGKNTPGKRCPDDSMREWDFNHTVAQYAAHELADYEGVQTKFTHDTTPSRDVPLKERTNTANAWGADCFVSIHANALTGQWGNAKGIETFTFTTKSKDSVALANAVHSKLIAKTGLFNRGVKSANYHVLRESHMTAILVECGFMDNRDEAALLKSDSYRRKCAAAIVAGLVANYGLKTKKKKPVTPTPPPTPDKPEVSKMEKWKIDMANTAITSLAKKGVLSDPEGWKKKVANGEAEKDLAWLIFYLADSASNLPKK